MESPDVYNLTRIRWQLFGTLSFLSEQCPESVRLSMWFAHCRKTCSNFRIYFPSLPWCLRQEAGEINGRRHFHYLLGGLPEEAVTLQTTFAQVSAWERFKYRNCTKPKCKQCSELASQGREHKIRYENPAWNVGGGMAEVRLFNPALNGLDYVASCLGYSGADVYESAKFGRSSGLMLSKAAQAMLGRGIREDRRFVERSEKISVGHKVSQAKSTVCLTPRNRRESAEFLARGELSSSAYALSKTAFKLAPDAFHALVDKRADVKS